jgi:hypothetical protein
MTLVIAHRIDKERLTFSSDSRLSVDGHGYFDKGIKIFNVPFRLRGPSKSSEDFDKYEFEYSYGLAVIGNSINAYTVKDSIVELLTNLQYLSNISDISIIGIGHLILKVYSDVSKELGQTFREKGLAEILIGGYCIQEQQIRLIRFFPLIESDKEIEFRFEEILIEDGICFFGSGKKIAEIIYKENDSLKPLQIIKKAIEQGSEKSIGGTLQHGKFYNNNFKISGVVEKLSNSEGRSPVRKYYLRGFELDQSRVTKEYPFLFVSYSYEPVE